MKQAGTKFIWAFLAVLILGWVFPENVFAAGNTQQQINEAEKNKEQLEEMISAHEKELQGMKGAQSKLQKRLAELNAELTTVSEQLASLEQQIVDKEAEIAVTQTALTQAKEKEAWQYDCMEKHVKYSYERNEMSWLSNMFHAKSFATMLNMVTYAESVASYSDRMLEEIIATRKYIESEEARLEKENQELNVLKSAAEEQKQKVNGLISQVSASITEYADQIDDAEKKAKAYENEMKSLEKNIKYLKKKLAEEIAMSQLAANSTWRNISDIQFAEGDRYLLANLIYCEAGGEPYAGQVAVGAVVINRVLSAKFPDTVVGVIYQKRQFSPVGSGRLELALALNKATPSCYRAADEAMSGVSNVGNCVFFRTPIEGLTGINIGGHVFY